jgi:hypothetical protein
MGDGIFGKLQRAFEERVSSLENWKKGVETLLSGGGVSTNTGDLPNRVRQLENEIRMIKARMGKQKEQSPLDGQS